MEITSLKQLLTLAGPLAAANQLAFGHDRSHDARETLEDLWNGMKNLDTEATSTAGIMLRRDGEGGIEAWVTPAILGWVKK